MRLCTLCHPHKKYTNSGWYTHMARKHNVHVKDLDVVTVKENEEWKIEFKVIDPSPSPLAIPCPHPFCPEIVTEADVLAHVEKEHPDWKLGDGRFVFEVAD